MSQPLKIKIFSHANPGQVEVDVAKFLSEDRTRIGLKTQLQVQQTGMSVMYTVMVTYIEIDDPDTKEIKLDE